MISLEEVRRRKALEELLKQHQTYLTSLARKLCQGHLDPDDLVQDLVEKLMRNAQSLPTGPNHRAWFARALQNLFIDKLRRRNTRREEPLEDPVAVPVSESDETWWQRLTGDQIRACLVRLPDDQRRTFEMFAFERRSYDEIAAELGIAKATVGTRISRAREKLRTLLTEEHGDE